jgi:hypothetical protein
MQLKYTRQKGIIGLELQHKPEGDGAFPLVAFMLNYEKTPYWIICDRRLSRVMELSPYPDLDAGYVRCMFKPNGKQERLIATSLLNNYQEAEDGTLHWSTFDGIVKGLSILAGEKPLYGRDHSPALYFTRDQGLEVLKRIQGEWEAYTGKPEDHQVNNPHLQITRRELVARVRDKVSIFEDASPGI